MFEGKLPKVNKVKFENIDKIMFLNRNTNKSNKCFKFKIMKKNILKFLLIMLSKLLLQCREINKPTIF